MNYGPAGYEDDWDEDEFDFGEYGDTTCPASTNIHSSSAHNGQSVQQHVQAKTFGGSVNGHSQTNYQTNKKASAGRGRGRGGFPMPAKTQNTNMKNKTSNVQNSQNENGRKGQGNYLFARTAGNMKQQSDERDSQLAEDLRSAIVKGDSAMVINILSQGISVDYTLKSGWTGLMHAVNCGHLAVVALLIERGANVNYHKDMYTVLMAACSSDCDAEEDLVQCVTHLIENGAKVNCHDRYHMTPLMYACRNGRASIVDILLSHKSDISKQDQRGWNALCWAASRGHGKVVRMLLDENANPKQYTNDGQSAEDLAYDGGFTIIANILNAAVNPSRRSLAENNTPNDAKYLDGKTGCLRYGDLELFLFGLELGHLIPLLQEQKITFDAFFQLTDADLQEIGVSQIGIRKTILAAIHDVHTKEWDLSAMPTQQSSKAFTSDDMNLVLANVEKYLIHIQSSVCYTRRSLLSMQDPTVVVQDEQRAQQFVDRTRNVLRAVSEISEEVSNLEGCIKKISTGVPSLPADLIPSAIPETNPDRNRSLFLPLIFIGGSVALGLATVYLINRDS